jgi:hypothetical protein
MESNQEGKDGYKKIGGFCLEDSIDGSVVARDSARDPGKVSEGIIDFPLSKFRKPTTPP